eukprot:511213-Pelagomonas_calceolata.AAC.3
MLDTNTQSTNLFCRSTITGRAASPGLQAEAWSALHSTKKGHAGLKVRATKQTDHALLELAVHAHTSLMHTSVAVLLKIAGYPDDLLQAARTQTPRKTLLSAHGHRSLVHGHGNSTCGKPQQYFCRLVDC